MRAHGPTQSRATPDGCPSDLLVRSIEHCQKCAQACTECANACLTAPVTQELSQCVRLNLNCADLCHAAAGVGSRCVDSGDEIMVRTLEICASACHACAEENERCGNSHEKCRVSALECRACYEACIAAMQDAGGETGLIQTN